MNEQTLTSLAVLTVNWNHGKDAIESFVPIVAECVRKDARQPMSLVELQKAVERGRNQDPERSAPGYPHPLR